MFMPNADWTAAAAWATIPRLISGPDWLSGGTYFIRNRRQPSTYWWVSQGYIRPSEQRRTKFKIKLETESKESQPIVLTRKDKIVVTVVRETTVSPEVRAGSTCVSVCRGNRLTLSTRGESYQWTFGDLVSGKVGVEWPDEYPGEDSWLGTFLALMLNGGGEEWELC